MSEETFRSKVIDLLKGCVSVDSNEVSPDLIFDEKRMGTILELYGVSCVNHKKEES